MGSHRVGHNWNDLAAAAAAQSLWNMRNLNEMLWKDFQNTNFNENIKYKNIEGYVITQFIQENSYVHICEYVNTKKFTVRMLIKLLITLISG